MNSNQTVEQAPATLQELVEAMQELAAAEEMGAVHRVVCAAARRIAGADGATYVLRDGKQCHYVEEDASEPLWKGSYVPIDECISGWTIIYRQAVVISDIELDDRLRPETYRPTFVKSMAMVPIRSIAPLGAIGTYWDRIHTPSRAELSGLQVLAEATAVTLENGALSACVLNDPLSGLYNRRGFFARGTERISSNRDRQAGTSVALAALTGVQAINDRSGYEAGDEAIRRIGVALQSVCGADAVIGRITGNTFAVCGSDETLPGDDPDLLERIVGEATPGPIGLTIGIARAEHGEVFDLDTLVAAANRAMYERLHGREPAEHDQVARSADRT